MPIASSLQVVSLVADLLAALGEDFGTTSALAFHDIQAALIASERFENVVLSTQDFEAKNQSGALLLVGIPANEVKLMYSHVSWSSQASLYSCAD